MSQVDIIQKLGDGFIVTTGAVREEVYLDLASPDERAALERGLEVAHALMLRATRVRESAGMAEAREAHPAFEIALEATTVALEAANAQLKELGGKPVEIDSAARDMVAAARVATR